MSRKFPDKAPTEVKLCTFDFGDEVADGATLSNPAVAKALISGEDTGAASLTVGSPSVEVGTTRIKVLVSAGTTGNIYKLTATVDASNQERHRMSATMRVTESA